MKYQEGLNRLREYYNSSNAGIEKLLGLSNGYISKIEKNPGKLLSALSEKGVSLDWFLTGEGTPFIRQGIGAVAEYTPPGAGAARAQSAKLEEVFAIPLLTKEQVFHFDPKKEIPDPAAHSGEYPEEILIPASFRIKEFGTDLRAIVVFNSRMAPLLNAGDVAVFEATGWNGDGVYVYRVGGELHISQAQFTEGLFRLTKRFRPEEEIPYDVATFTVIGRVRAVVKEVH